MDIRDITNEHALLKSYKRVFVDNQSYELLKIYRDRQGKFPIFLDRVFNTDSRTPVGLINYKMREKLDEKLIGRIFILERNDRQADKDKTRLFFVWLSPKLVEHFKSTTANAADVKASVIFHPLGGLDRYPAYWNGDIDPPKFPNFLELGARYLCKEKHSVTQHICALKPVKEPGKRVQLDASSSVISVMVVVPVASARAYMNMANPAELEEALKQIARRCHEGVTSTIATGQAPMISRVAVSGYSRSGVLLRALLNNSKLNEPFLRKTLKEFYAFDVMLDEKDEKGNLIKSKQQGYDELWSKLKAWQGDDSDKKIRLYSAEPSTVFNIYTELKSRLQKYGGGYHNQTVPFSSFNKTPSSDGRSYANLSDGYEIYSTDNSRSLVVLPSNNSLVYLSTENIQNPQGFAPGGDYEPQLEGHSWFVSRLMSHALFHSGF